MSFYTSLTGLKAATTELALTSNNIANVGTSGFKKSRASFGDIFATSPLQKSTSVVGQGVSLKEVRQEFSQGNVEFSSNTLDLAISGEGFFPLKSADGLTDIFTRNGSFVLNEQFNVVNSSGQALLAAAVDSSGKADLEKLSRLAIPVSTSGQALETSQIELALNLPSDAEVITAPFNRNNPDTYNKSTALSVYDAGGNSYLATIYYVKTANATANSPSNKYQTYVFVGDDQVNPALQQVTDDNLEEVYVNKYGVLKPFSEVEDLLVNRKTQKFALDDLTDVRTSVPATVVGSKLPNDLTADQGFNFSTSAYTAADLRNFMTVDIDETGNPVTVDLSSFKSENRNITGVELAQFIQNQLNVKFGDDRYFDLTTTSSQTFTVNYADTSGTTTVDVDLGTTFNTEQLQRTATVDAVVEDIQSQIDATLTNGEVTVSYDFASRTFRFMPSSSSDTVSLSSASTNNLFKTTPTPSAVDSDGLYGETITPNGELIRAASEQRFGMGVSYDGAQQTFSFSSGTTGDTSQIALNFSVPEYDTTSGDQLLDNDGNLTGTLTAQVDFATFMGFEVTGTTDSQYSELPSDEAIRGVVSLPAITRGSSIAVNVNNNFSVDASNNTFVVSVNDVKGTLVLPTSSGYTLDSFIIELEKGINQLASDSGSTVSGVTVEYDPDSNGLVFTTGTTGTDSFIKVSGSATWGMANIESGRGTTTT